MEVRTEMSGPAVLIHLEGRLTVEENARRLHQLVRSAARLNPEIVVLDLEQVRQIDCAGIGQLWSGSTGCTKSPAGCGAAT